MEKDTHTCACDEEDNPEDGTVDCDHTSCCCNKGCSEDGILFDEVFCHGISLGTFQKKNKIPNEELSSIDEMNNDTESVVDDEEEEDLFNITYFPMIKNTFVRSKKNKQHVNKIQRKYMMRT